MMPISLPVSNPDTNKCMLSYNVLHAVSTQLTSHLDNIQHNSVVKPFFQPKKVPCTL